MKKCDFLWRSDNFLLSIRAMFILSKLILFCMVSDILLTVCGFVDYRNKKIVRSSDDVAIPQCVYFEVSNMFTVLLAQKLEITLVAVLSLQLLKFSA